MRRPVLPPDQLDEDVDGIGARQQTGSSCQAIPSMANPRSRARSRALTAATRTDRPSCDANAVAMLLEQPRNGRADRAQSRDAEPERCVHKSLSWLEKISGWR